MRIWPQAEVAADLTEVLLDDVRLMLTHALTTGRQVPPAWVDTVVAAQAAARPLTPEMLRRVSRCHDGLSRAVAPATPRTLKFLEQRKHAKLVVLLLGVAFVFLVAFVGLATDKDVGGSFSEFATSSGHKLLLNLLFQLSAAGLGATFAALFAVNARLRDRSLDPREMFSNWVRVILGLVSGLVLAQLAPVNGNSKAFGRPLLALLGGFSVDVVYQTLKRLVELAGSLIDDGPGTAAAVAKERADTREAQVRTALAQQLVRLRATLPDGPATQALDAMLADLTPVDPVETTETTDAEPPAVPDETGTPEPPPPDTPPPDTPPAAPPEEPDPAPDAAPDTAAVPDAPDEPAPDPVADGRSDVTTPARPRRRRASG